MLILSPKVGEESATILADFLEVKYENPYDTGNTDYRHVDVVFKYGVSKKIKAKTVINKSKAVSKARDKLAIYTLFKGTEHEIPYTLDKEEAYPWLKNKGMVLARALIKGDNGKGITFCTTKKELDVAPAKFYTRFIPHDYEFRVNVWRNKIVSIYQKKRNGDYFKFIFVKGDVTNDKLQSIVDKIHTEVGLDWYGMDVLVDKKGTFRLLELNSAPIMFPITVKRLAKILKEEYNV